MKIGDIVEFSSIASGKKLIGEVIYEDRLNESGKRRQLLEVLVGDVQHLTHADKCRKIRRAKSA